MSFWKRLLECILAAVLTVLLSAGSARPVSAEETGGQEKIKAGDILCFGTPDEACGFDGKWLVLDSEQTNTGGEGMFLVSLSRDERIGSVWGSPMWTLRGWVPLEGWPDVVVHFSLAVPEVNS